MIISKSRRFVFVHIHKTGGTSMAHALDPFLAWDDIVLGATPRGHAINLAYKQRFGLNKHSSVAEIEAVCGRDLIEDYYVFALVRRPIDRACSYYNFIGAVLDRWSAREGVPFSEIPAYLAANPGAEASFPELGWPDSRAFLATSGFSEFLHRDLQPENHAMRTQVSRLRDRKGEVAGEPLKLEDAESWLPELGRRIGADLTFGRLNESGSRRVDPQALSREDVRRVHELYAEDYERFGY